MTDAYVCANQMSFQRNNIHDCDYYGLAWLLLNLFIDVLGIPYMPTFRSINTDKTSKLVGVVRCVGGATI